jgi:hypothetical protein
MLRRAPRLVKRASSWSSSSRSFVLFPFVGSLLQPRGKKDFDRRRRRSPWVRVTISHGTFWRRVEDTAGRRPKNWLNAFNLKLVGQQNAAAQSHPLDIVLPCTL